MKQANLKKNINKLSTLRKEVKKIEIESNTISHDEIIAYITEYANGIRARENEFISTLRASVANNEIIKSEAFAALRRTYIKVGVY